MSYPLQRLRCAAAVSGPSGLALAQPPATLVLTPPSADPPAAISVEPVVPDLLARINTARPAPGSASFEDGWDPLLARVQTLLDRAHFSPGVIDGRPGANTEKAVASFRAAMGLPGGGIDEALLDALLARDAAPAFVAHVIQPEEVEGPFAATPRGFAAQAQRKSLPFASRAEALAERFHMDESLLRLLNPDADFGAGTEILVAMPRTPLNQPVLAIEVDKGLKQIRAFGPEGAMLAVYPITIGSAEHPAPSGEHSVRAVAVNPVYIYDPKRLPSFGDIGLGRLTIPPGPNNPVGLVWIALSLDSYGLHGTPAPALIGKTFSHGCIRMTNWDALELARAVQIGAPVRFIEAVEPEG